MYSTPFVTIEKSDVYYQNENKSRARINQVNYMF